VSEREREKEREKKSERKNGLWKRRKGVNEARGGRNRETRGVMRRKEQEGRGAKRLYFSGPCLGTCTCIRTHECAFAPVPT